MNRYVKSFLQRGLIFGGFGPIVTAIVFFIVSLTVENVTFTGSQLLLAVVSTYLLAFIHAGASVFNQIDHWPLAKSLGIHFATLYLAYSLCYAMNSWIAFEPMVLLIFTAIFAVGYFAVWLTVFLSVRATGARLNRKLK
jgi:hypothetical protein